ncbi:VOC family protein [Streptomyces sp. NPDC048516]|uniref:VOC family protein n=1 Tax=Streptomyces sp. NPDC048516 TaxID=3365565 RepID=UPI00371CCEEE
MSHITFGVVALDCPDPRALADFYADMLGWQVTEEDEDWVEVAGPDGRTLAFQRVAEGYRPPQWPGQDMPQQLHLDFDVPRAKIDEAERTIVALGAKLVQHDDGKQSWRVYLDPAGHPFCLCMR